MTSFSGVLTGSDGSTLTIKDATLSTQPQPEPGLNFPEGANLVTIGALSYPLTAIDPPTTDPTQPGGRGRDQLIIITIPATAARNQYGLEAEVTPGDIITATGLHCVVRNRGYVLSGHGLASDFLRNVARIGQPVSVTKTAVPPPLVVTGGRTMGVYLMDGVGHVSQLPSRCNRAIVAFYQGTDLVEWGGDSPSQTARDLTAWRAVSSNEVLVSLGGQGGAVDLGMVPAGIAAINATRFPVDGIDFDAEAFSYTPSDAVNICQRTALAIGRAPANFVVQFVPPGGPPVAAALAAAKAVKAAGFRVNFGQQLYETTITDQDVLSATGLAVVALGEESVLVGMMIGDSHNSWTVENAVSRMKLVLARYPRIGGAYLWESSRNGTAAVVQGVGAVLGL